MNKSIKAAIISAITCFAAISIITVNAFNGKGNDIEVNSNVEKTVQTTTADDSSKVVVEKSISHYATNKTVKEETVKSANADSSVKDVTSKPNDSKAVKDTADSKSDNVVKTDITVNSNIQSTYYNINLSENDLMMMCTIVSSEAGYCDDTIQKAIAHTILNRFNNDNFPNTMYEITTQYNQYTAIHSYFDGQYRDGLYPGSERWNHSMQLCKEALNEYDFTGGAVAYYNPNMIGYNEWFESLTLTYVNQYGRFFKI